MSCIVRRIVVAEVVGFIDSSACAQVLRGASDKMLIERVSLGVSLGAVGCWLMNRRSLRVKSDDGWANRNKEVQFRT